MARRGDRQDAGERSYPARVRPTPPLPMGITPPPGHANARVPSHACGRRKVGVWDDCAWLGRGAERLTLCAGGSSTPATPTAAWQGTLRLHSQLPDSCSCTAALP